MACDFKKADEKTPFEAITEWLSLFKANLEVINIAARGKDFKADQAAESITVQNRLHVFRPHFNFLTGNNIAVELTEFVKGHPIDLLMVFPGKHGIINLFHKKNSKFIINHCQFPVLSIHDNKV